MNMQCNHKGTMLISTYEAVSMIRMKSWFTVGLILRELYVRNVKRAFSSDGRPIRLIAWQ